MGSIKVFGGKKHVAATHIRLITDHNEIFNHLLKAVYVTLSLRNPGGAAVSYTLRTWSYKLTVGWSQRCYTWRLLCIYKRPRCCQCLELCSITPDSASRDGGCFFRGFRGWNACANNISNVWTLEWTSSHVSV